MGRSSIHVTNPWYLPVILLALGLPTLARAQAPSLPDLIVTDFWEDKGVISFTLKNTGTKIASAGHTAYLNVDGQDMDTAYIAVTIGIGQTYTTAFAKYSWKCTTSGKHTLVVRADGTDKVAELNEQNNSRQELWICDVTAPVITAGPTVTNVTTSSARVGWTTNESSDSVVRYGPAPNQYAGMKSSTTPVLNHSLLLNNLQADTLYYFVVESTDAADNTVHSKEQHFRTEAQPPELPDLVITDIWTSDYLIHFRIENAGDSTADTGHHAGLYLTDHLIDSLRIAPTLAPGESAECHFEKFYFECFDPQQTLRVTADIDDVIVEKNEDNNAMDKTFVCDPVPPKIVSGPSAQEITTKSVALVWETDKACDGTAFYDSRAGVYGQKATTSFAGTKHRISLGKLTPGTVYQFKVRSTDTAGLSVTSHPGYFQTQSQAGGQAPTIRNLSFRRLETKLPAYAMEAEASDDTEIEKVEFYVDGMLLCTDYSPPYEAVIAPGVIGPARARFFQPHPVQVIATDSSRMLGTLDGLFDPPYECNEVYAEFELPYPSEKVYTLGDAALPGTEVPIQVRAYTVGATCVSLGGIVGPPGTFAGEMDMVCDFEELPVREVEFFVNGSPIGVVPSNPSHLYSIPWDASGYPVGEHSLRADVVGGDDCIQTIMRTIEIKRGRVELELTRRVWREGNAFRIELTVRNRGTVDYACDAIHDNLNGLFAVPETRMRYEIIPRAAAGAGDCDVDIDLFDEGQNSATIYADRSFTAEYHAIPALGSSYPFWADHPIGREEVEIIGGPSMTNYTFNRPCHRTEDDIALTDELAAAIRTADFLLVTNQDNCVSEFGSADTVLGQMATLAYHRSGVLGLLDNWVPAGWSPPSAATIRDQIAAWGATMAGSGGAGGGYLSNGYLLLVGEREIVPAWTIRTDASDPNSDVSLSDLPYGDVSGADNVPELLVGRIIGNNAGDLAQAMQASLDSAFDRSFGVVTSGYEEDWENFVGSAEDIYDVWAAQAAAGDFMTDGRRKHHWSAYVQKEELVGGYDFPLAAGDGFLMAHISGAPVALRIDPEVGSTYRTPAGDLDPDASPRTLYFRCPFAAGDALAAGDLDGDGSDEVVFGALGGNEIVVAYDPPHTSDVTHPSCNATLEPGDVIACGDVLGLGKDQVVVARTTGGGSLRIYEYENVGTPSLSQRRVLTVPFCSSDGFAVGDVNAANPGDEIIVASSDDSRIYIYDQNGNSIAEIACDPYTAYDGLLAGDTDGDGADEIAVVIDDTIDSKRRLRVFQNDCWFVDPNGVWQVKDRQSFLVYSRFLYFDGARSTGGGSHYDGISCTDVDGDGRDEICIAHEHEDRLYVIDAHYSRSWKDRYLPVLEGIADRIDLLVMRGHGNEGSCSPLSQDDVGRLDLAVHPVVLVLSCLTGNYEGNGDNGYAEKFFDQGAGVYIGSTEVSSSTWNSQTGSAFFTEWAAGDPVGKAFGDYRRDRAATGEAGWRRWTLEYNYYGDPKFGSADSAVAGAPPAGTGIAIAAAPPLPGWNEKITIPAYEVKTADGRDLVTIPGGALLLEDGKPGVPYYKKQWELPPGTIVQDVRLRERSGLQTDFGLVLPVTVARVDAAGAPAQTPAEPAPSWFPRKDLEWRLVPNANGSTTLLVLLYPFFYNSFTTEVRFYQEYTIDVETISSNVGIVALATDAIRYQPGDLVTANLGLFGTGATEDVFVDVTIRQYGSDALVAGLLLRRLSALSGPASFSPTWDSGTAPPGHYYVDVTIANPANEVLARRQAPFELGEVAGNP